MINAAIYPRKSKQVDNSDSMEVQVQMCIDFLNKRYGENNYLYTLYDKDYGITGHSTKKRKDFLRMMEDVRTHKINLVVIQRYDRIARNMYDFCCLYHDIELNKSELVSVSQNIDTTTPYGKKFMYDQASMAELEWALCSERRKDSNRYARMIGKYTLPDKSITIGYKAEKIDGIRRLVIDREKYDLVRDSFEFYAKTHNYSATAKYMNEKYGLSYTVNMVKHMVHNQFYIGKYRENDNFCEPYFTKKEWERIQEKKAVIRYDNKKTQEILFSGLCICPSCGRKLRAQNKKHKSGKQHRYYHCEYHSVGNCPNKKIKSELLIESMLIENMDKFIDIKEATLVLAPSAKKNETVIDVKSIESELNRLNTMYQKGRIDDKYYDSEYDRLTELLKLKKENNIDAEDISRLKKVFSGNWKELYNQLDKLHKKLFWREIIKEIHFTENMEIKEIIFM